MIRINLLPHRERKRAAQKRQIALLSGAAVAFGVLLVLLVHLAIESRIGNQNARNAYLKEQISVLDRQIQDIKKLKEQTHSLLARKKVVEQLQENRAEAVHLLDQLVRRIPDGIYLTSMREDTQNNVTKINLVGYAQSNARVSTLMRSLGESSWLTAPELIQIQSVTVNNMRLSEFNVVLTLAHQAGASNAAAPQAVQVIKP